MVDCSDLGRSADFGADVLAYVRDSSGSDPSVRARAMMMRSGRSNRADNGMRTFSARRC